LDPESFCNHSILKQHQILKLIKIHMTKVMVGVVTRSAKINHVGRLIYLRNKKFEIFNMPDSNHIRFTREAQQANSY